ncbi:MAG: HAMP domain-containing protein, partial [Deltaproteobacteria bacterium]|nr:HAMP domain-containing protein [Deltaproteobacteria bacterium]
MARPLPKLFRRQTLKGTLTLLLLLILVPVLAVQAGIYWNWYRTQKQREIEANLEMARAVAGTFDEYLHGLLRQEKAIGLAFASLRPMTSEQMTRYLGSVARSYPAVRSLGWISPEGTVLAATEPKTIGADLRDRSHVARILSGAEWVVTDLMRSPFTGRITVGVLLGSRDEAGRLAGVVAAYLDPDGLGKVLKVERANGGAIVVLDRSGKIVYRPRAAMTWDQRDSMKGLPLVRQALGGREAASIAASGLDGRKRTLALVPVRSFGWAAGACRETGAVLGPIRRGVVRDSLLFLLVASAAWGAASLTGRRLSSNLSRLSDQTSVLASAGLEEVAVEGPREFVQLADSFNRMFENVTENKRLQEQLFHVHKMESLGYLAAGVAHDFNNLLAVVAGNAELAMLALPEDSRASRNLAQIETAARRAAELTDKMLDYAGENPSALEKVDLSRVIGEMGGSIEAALAGRAVFHRELAADLPTIDADPSQLRRVVLSLLTNAS